MDRVWSLGPCGTAFPWAPGERVGGRAPERALVAQRGAARLTCAPHRAAATPAAPQSQWLLGGGPIRQRKARVPHGEPAAAAAPRCSHGGELCSGMPAQLWRAAISFTPCPACLPAPLAAATGRVTEAAQRRDLHQPRHGRADRPVLPTVRGGRRRRLPKATRRQPRAQPQPQRGRLPQPRQQQQQPVAQTAAERQPRQPLGP